MNFKLLALTVAMAVMTNQALFAEKVKEREKERTKEGQEGTIENKLRERGRIGEELQNKKKSSEETLERFKAKGGDGFSEDGTVPGARRGKGASKSSSELESLEGGSHGKEGFTPTNRMKKAFEAAETAGRGREEANKEEMNKEDKAVATEAVKTEEKGLEATVEGKKGKAAVSKVKEVEESTRLFTNTGPNFSKDKAYNEAIRRLVEGIKAESGGDVELALRVMGEKMLKEGKSFQEVEATIAEFMAFWKANIEGKLPEELREKSLANMLTVFFRGPKGLSTMKAKLEAILKEKDADTILKGLALSNKDSGEKFLQAIKDGKTIAEAYKEAGKSELAFLKGRGLTNKEAIELIGCKNPLNAATAAAALLAGH